MIVRDKCFQQLQYNSSISTHKLGKGGRDCSREDNISLTIDGVALVTVVVFILRGSLQIKSLEGRSDVDRVPIARATNAHVSTSLKPEAHLMLALSSSIQKYRIKNTHQPYPNLRSRFVFTELKRTILTFAHTSP